MKWINTAIVYMHIFHLIHSHPWLISTRVLMERIGIIILTSFTWKQIEDVSENLLKIVESTPEQFKQRIMEDRGQKIESAENLIPIDLISEIVRNQKWRLMPLDLPKAIATASIFLACKMDDDRSLSLEMVVKRSHICFQENATFLDVKSKFRRLKIGSPDSLISKDLIAEKVESEMAIKASGFTKESHCFQAGYALKKL